MTDTRRQFTAAELDAMVDRLERGQDEAYPTIGDWIDFNEALDLVRQLQSAERTLAALRAWLQRAWMAESVNSDYAHALVDAATELDRLSAAAPEPGA